MRFESVSLSPAVVACTLSLVCVLLGSCVTKPAMPTGKSSIQQQSAQIHSPTSQTPTAQTTQATGETYAQQNMPSPTVHATPQAPQAQILQIQTQVPQAQLPPQLPPAKRQYGSFEEWKKDFMIRASLSHNPTLVRQLFAGASYNANVIRLDNNQAEFAKMAWEYLKSAVSNNRIKQGQSKGKSQLALLRQNEITYGVPASIVIAIWGLESSFGAGMGDTDLVNALASLAYDGRRREFAEEQLLAMVTMVERGDVRIADFRGSWAGGMGHTQFIPATWLNYGVDGNHDGKKNPYTSADALSATANYLSKSGWVRHLPAYIEVRLPNNITPNTLNPYLLNKQSLDTWHSLGLVGIHGERLSGADRAELWLPAGIYGPAILTTQNFDVIKVYNNSSNYALAVAALANGIDGKTTIVAKFPNNEQGLSRSQITQLQHNLTRAGYDTKGVDGIAGANTRLAFARWQAANGRFADGFISQNSAMGLY